MKFNNIENSEIRVRFAPAPTGSLHIGNLRTALFNWVFAKRNNGKFLIRIEDTDLERSEARFVEEIKQSLDWVGIQSDEALVYQSKRTLIYNDFINKLLAEKKVYKCFCSKELLEKKKELAIQNKENYKYDKNCFNLEINEQNLPYVIRFNMSNIQESVFEFFDLIKGKISLDLSLFDDFIIAKEGDKKAVVYNFAVVVDDAAMRITHVIRGEDHLLNTVKQLLLYAALNYKIPYFAHLPLILSKDGQKLSKRELATSVLDYKNSGYLSDALLNCLAKLGWSFQNKEVFTMKEMIDNFSLEDVNKKGSIFDPEKLNWLNSQYLKNNAPERLIDLIKQCCSKDLSKDTEKWEYQKLLNFVNLYKERAENLLNLYDQIIETYYPPVKYDKEDLTKLIEKVSLENIIILKSKLDALDFNKSKLEELLKIFCRDYKLRIANLSQLLRIIILGKISGPGIFDLIFLLGKKDILERISMFVDFFKI